MLSHHKKTLIGLFEQCHKIYANPQESVQDCLSVQETLIRKITYVERRIRERKEAIKNLKNRLGGHDTIRLNKEDARKAKEQIQQYHYQIDEYQELATIYRDIGDALAFSYIDKWDIKPLAIKETAGALSGKKGSRLERKILRKAFNLGHIVLLNDITNCLRYGDITVPKDGKFMIIEAKSGKRRTNRDSRQSAETQSLMKYFETDKTDRLYRKDGTVRRVGLGTTEIHHREKINELVLSAIEHGISFMEIESGLFYIVSANLDIDIANNILTKLKITGKPIASLLSRGSRNHIYFPIILTIQDPESLYKFYDGQISIVTIIDTDVIESKLNKYNLHFSLIENDSDWIAEILENEISIMKVSSSLWLRLHAEFISLEWFINDMIIRGIKSRPLDIPQ
jgi:hypothetical protein